MNIFICRHCYLQLSVPEKELEIKSYPADEQFCRLCGAVAAHMVAVEKLIMIQILPEEKDEMINLIIKIREQTFQSNTLQALFDSGQLAGTVIRLLSRAVEIT